MDRIAPHVEPALRAIAPDVYVDALKIALSEDIAIEDRRSRIARILRGELGQPLTRELNERMDSSILSESMEEKALKVVSYKIIDELVDWTVGEIDEKLSREQRGM